MLARWPGLFIQASMTAAASAWPRAMFSPPRSDMPALAARSHGVAPSGSVWSKNPRAAMSSLNFSARFDSALFAERALQPTLDRSSLTSFSTSAAACVSAETVTGDSALCGALVTVFFDLEGVLRGSVEGVVPVASGFSVAVLVGAADEVETEGVGEAGDGEADRP